MTSDRGSTTVTVTQASASRPTAIPGTLALTWLFPLTLEPPTDLTAGGDEDVVIGRDATCGVRLQGNDVSRRHAALRRERPDGGVMIVDLGSRNGIRVNGKVTPLAALHEGDVVGVGGWIGVVTAAPGAFREIASDLWGGAALQAALAPLQLAARSDLPIVIEGETGTGKEVVSRSLHAWSGRTGPLVAVNCAALPEGLAEGELFGYRRGAFTGADRASPGYFRSADGGTLLLDEVSDLPLALQAKLLRVLEERAVQPLGETRPVPIDVRIVVAGQQSLMDAVREERFRPDLLARLEGMTVHLPPLRQRREDVPPLFSHLLQKMSEGRAPAVDGDLVERLCLHDWPFNVRELVQLVRRLLILNENGATLGARHLPPRIGETESTSASEAAPARKPSAPAEPIELPGLVAALRAAGGNVARASAMLGITRQRAYRLMEAQGVDLEALRKAEEEHR